MIADLIQSIQELKNVYYDYEIIEKIEQFNKNCSELENLLIKAGNYKNSQRVVFIGREASKKKELLSELINFIPDSNLKNKFIEYNFCSKNNSNSCANSSNYEESETCLKINLLKSQNSVFNEITIFDTPIYSYSKELDNEIVENCKDANIFVLVLNAVGSIGDKDKNFLTRISMNVFVNKLVFIFTNMENVPERDLTRTKKQHKSNASRIANEILRVPQTDIPIFFVRNNQFEDIEKFLLVLRNFNLTSRDEKDICENGRTILRNLQTLIEDERSRIFKENSNKNNSEKRINEKVVGNESYESFSKKLDLIKKWRNNVKQSIFRVDKNEDFPLFSEFEKKKTKIEKVKTKIAIENKFKEIEEFKKEIESEREKNKTPQSIILIINKYVKLFDHLIHFNKKFNIDQFKSLSKKYDKLIDFTNKIIDSKLFGCISTFLVDIELELLLILIYYRKHKWKIKIKNPTAKCRNRKIILKDILSNITCSKIKNEKFSVFGSNEVENTKPINNQKEFLDKSDELLMKMLANVKFMINHFDRNKIFV